MRYFVDGMKVVGEKPRGKNIGKCANLGECS